MCNLCNGTHVVHEIQSFGYRTSCCPVCGPVPDEIWQAGIENILADIRNKKEGVTNEIGNHKN